MNIDDICLGGSAGRADAIDCGDERSSNPLVLVAIDDPDIGFKAELNSPNPLDALLIFRSARGGGAVVFGFGGGLGPVSKKFPPLRGIDDTWGGAGADR